MKYRKKPVVVDAIRFWNGDDGKNTIQACEEFCDKKAILVNKRIDPNCTKSFLSIHPYGNYFIKVPNGHIITKNNLGDFETWSPEGFEKTYEKVEE